MSVVQEATAGARRADERVAAVGPWRRLLVKPELGSLIGAVVILLFFSVQSEVFRSLGGIANWLDVARRSASWRSPSRCLAEPTVGWGPFRRFGSRRAKEVTRRELAAMGIDIRHPDQPVGTLSGGERQSVAIARAVHFGARVLILDEPTSALGVKQAGVVLRYIAAARDKGVGVVFSTHNPHHAHPVGDRFLLLNRGRSLDDFAKGEVSQEELTTMMAGGGELTELAEDLERPASA